MAERADERRHLGADKARLGVEPGHVFGPQLILEPNDVVAKAENGDGVNIALRNAKGRQVVKDFLL